VSASPGSAILGLVTIGQSPRVDVLADIVPVLAGRRYVEHGALDDFDAEQLRAVAPEAGQPPLVSRLRDGGSVRIDHTKIVPLVAAAVDKCAEDGASAVLLMCTGHFEPFASRIPVYDAESLAQKRVLDAVGDAPFAVVTPVAEQVADRVSYWSGRAGRAVAVAFADPYISTLGQVAAAGLELASSNGTAKPCWIVLDCFGYSQAMADEVERVTGIPVLVTRLEAARQALLEIDAAANTPCSPADATLGE